MYADITWCWHDFMLHVFNHVQTFKPYYCFNSYPIYFSLIAWGLGHYFESLSHIELKGLSEMMLEGIKKLAPTGVMLLFAILYFALMIDAGLFDPPVKWILKKLKVTL